MKTFISYYDNFFRIEVASDKKSKVHAFAYIFFERLVNIFVVKKIDIVNVDCTGSMFSCFARFCANSSPTYLLSKCSDGAEVSLSDDLELNFEFE